MNVFAKLAKNVETLDTIVMLVTYSFDGVTKQDWKKFFQVNRVTSLNSGRRIPKVKTLFSLITCVFCLVPWNNLNQDTIRTSIPQYNVSTYIYNIQQKIYFKNIFQKI